MIKKLILSVFSTILYSQFSFCQSPTNSLSNWFDATVGRENLSINNGYIANEQYITRNNSNIYFKDSKFTLGQIFYDHQLYDDLSLNYDSYTDELLLKPNGSDDFKSVIVKQQYTSYFILQNKKFVNLNYAAKTAPNFLNGYFEESIISEKLFLYTKHGKTKAEKIDKLQVINEFSESKQFVLFHNNNFYKYSQSTLEQLFPSLKSQISSFYSENSKMQKSDEKLFIESLLTKINSLSK